VKRVDLNGSQAEGDTGVLRIRLKLAICVLACVIGAAGRPAAQSSVGGGKGTDLAQMPLGDIQVEVQGIEELFARLSFACNLPIGLELAQNEDVMAIYRLNFKKGTLSDLLTQFVAEHDQYAWRIDGGVVSVFPKEGHRDPLLRELLATEINNFSVKEKTDCQRFAQSLLNTPEIRKTLEGYGLTFDTGRFGGFYIQQLGQRFSLNFSEAPLKAILDKVIKESPAAKFWVIGRDRSMQKLSLRIKAKLEDPPKFNEESNSAHQNLH
jgi:hypothetical protein